MSRNEPNAPNVNALIVEKLRSFPPSVAELAMKAIQLSEQYPETTVVETMQGHLREIVRQRREGK